MEEEPPKVFANKVIRLLIRNLASEDFEVRANDYMAIRVLFRHYGGSWAELGSGDLGQVALLQNVVRAWAALPHTKKQVI
jgi:muramidase (phage lysozyme)